MSPPTKGRPRRLGGMSRPAPIFTWLGRWLDEPQPILRVELVRILAPLATLGFMSGRLAHADEWLGTAGFRVPDLGASDWRQPFYLDALPGAWCWVLAAAMVGSGLALSAGLRPRWAAGVFAACLTYVALSDRLAAFTVSKLSPAIALGLMVSPCGARFGVDAWRRRRRAATPEAEPELVAGGTARFFQALLVVLYCGSGVCKAHGDWLKLPLVLWTHVHDSYQTGFSWLLVRTVPGACWTAMQGAVLLFELFAPLWFAIPRTRTAALLFGLAMHVMIGSMFWPVRWFALLMITLLLAGFLPEDLLLRLGAPRPRGRAAAEAAEASTTG